LFRAFGASGVLDFERKYASLCSEKVGGDGKIDLIVSAKAILLRISCNTEQSKTNRANEDREKFIKHSHTKLDSFAVV
jgi:hypothetical protein